MVSYPYIIFVGPNRNNLEPYKSVATSGDATKEAVVLSRSFNCVEVVYMPEDNIDINDVVYTYCS